MSETATTTVKYQLFKMFTDGRFEPVMERPGLALNPFTLKKDGIQWIKENPSAIVPGRALFLEVHDIKVATEA